MYHFSLNDTTNEYVEKNLNETEEARKEYLEKLRKRLKEIRIYVQKPTIYLYGLFCAEIPEWFANRDPNLPDIRELVSLGVFVPLRKFIQSIQSIRTAVHNPKHHKQDDVFKADMMLLDLLGLENELLQVYGVIAIFDMKNISLAHARQLPPSRIKKAVYSWPKQLEFINAPLYINVVLNVFKRFMSEKLKGRVRVHFNGLGDLHQCVNKEVLPIEYGGDDDSIEDHIEYWAKRIFKYTDWFKVDEEYRTKIK